MNQKECFEYDETIARLEEENRQLREALGKDTCGQVLLQQQEEFSQLLSVSSSIVSELDIAKVFDLVADNARRIVNAELVLVPMLSENLDHYTYKAGSGEDAALVCGTSHNTNVGMCGWVLQHERSLLFGEESPHWLEDKTPWEEGQQSAVLVPLFGQKGIIGGLSALGKKGGGSFTKHDLDLLTMYANQVSIAIENAYHFQEWQNTITQLTLEIDERTRAEKSLQILFESTVDQIGQCFFDNLAHNLCSFFDCECAIVGKITGPNLVEAISMELDGKAIYDFSYKLHGSPCENVTQQGFCHYEENLLSLFPGDIELVKLHAAGYIGTPIKNQSGTPVGILCVISRQRLELPKGSEQVMSILAAKTAAEIERLEAENALQKSVQSLNEAQRLAKLGHHERNMLTSEVVWSEGFYRLFGFEPGEISSTIENFWSFVHVDDLVEMKKKYEDAFSNVQQFDCEFRAVKKSGEVVSMHALGEFICGSEDCPIYYRGTIQDITEKKRIEEELTTIRKLKSVGILAGGIAHDFNNILAAILGNINLALLYTQPGDKTHKLLTEAEKASLRAKDLTQQLLTFSKGGEPIKKVTAINDVITDSANFVLRGSKAQCCFNFAKDLWNVEIDSAQISQVIQNLMINSNQAMPDGGVIDVHVTNFYNKANSALPIKGSKFLEIKIQDSGLGIPHEMIGKVFDPYFTTKQGGSGLGLAVTYSIIKKHQGYIFVESKQGEGTIFTIYLPASEKSKPLTQQESSPADTVSSSAKIMIMDDEEIVRDVVKAMLGQLGHEVVLATDGGEAIELFKEARNSGELFDLIIMDLTIPGGMGGKDAVQEFLKLDPNAKVIVSSGYSNDPIMANFKEYGFSAAIVKPYQLQELSRAISELSG